MFRSAPKAVARQWDPEFGSAWIALGSRAVQLTQRAGTGVEFEKVMTQVRADLGAGDLEMVSERLVNRRYARALVTVWNEDEEVARRTMRGPLLQRLIDAQSPRLSRLATLSLISLFLRFFDGLEEWEVGLFEATARSIRTAVAQQPIRAGAPDVVEAIRQSPGNFLYLESPRDLARERAQSGEPLRDYFQKFGVFGYDNWRYGQLVRNQLYLVQIERANPSEEHDFLNELKSQSVFGAPDGDGLLFGHALIGALADKPLDPPSEQWLSTILEIAGDPRLKHTDTYRRWWSRIPDAAIARVVSWMSAEDLRLFLHAVEQFGEEHAVDSLIRLFPSRKAFLWGLYEAGHVVETRLILGSNAKQSMRRHLRKSIRMDFADLEAMPDQAIVYIDCGDFHIVEGSHNFKMWTYLGRPESLIADRSVRRYSRHDLILTLPTRHARNHPLGYAAHTDTVHNGFWQRGPLEFLAAHGIAVKAQDLMSRAEYETLKYKFGIPTVRNPRPNGRG